MACNCASDEQIKRILDKYGEGDISELSTAFKIKVFLADIYASIVSFLRTPYIIYYIIKESKNNDGKVSLSKFFKLRDYAK